jgi:hypothetical protein
MATGGRKNLTFPRVLKISVQLESSPNILQQFTQRVTQKKTSLNLKINRMRVMNEKLLAHLFGASTLVLIEITNIGHTLSFTQPR